MVAVGIHVHEWAVIRLPYFREIGAATGTRYSAFQPVFTRYKLLEIERRRLLVATPGAIRSPLTRRPKYPHQQRATASCRSVPCREAMDNRFAEAGPSHEHPPFPRLLRFFSTWVQWYWWCGVPCSAHVCQSLARPWHAERLETRPHPGAPGAFTGLCGALRCPTRGPTLCVGWGRTPGRPLS